MVNMSDELEGRLFTLQAFLLESLFDQSALKPALKLFANYCGAPIAHLLITDGRVVDGHRAQLHSTFSTELDQGLMSVEHHYWDISPRVHALANMKVGRATRDKDFITEEGIKKDASYQELIIPLGCEHFSAVMTVNEPVLTAGVLLHRSSADGPFSDFEAKRHEYFSRACANVLNLAEQVSDRHAKSALNLFGPNRAAAVIDREGRLIDFNDAFDKLSQRIKMNPKKHALPGFIGQHMLKSWQRVARDGQGTVQIFFPNSHLPNLLASIHPIPHLGHHIYNSGQNIVLFRETMLPLDFDRTGLQFDFQLTDAEAEVAILLACGNSIVGISNERNVAVGTTRSQIKRILSKVHKGSQQELIALVHGYRLI